MACFESGMQANKAPAPLPQPIQPSQPSLLNVQNLIRSGRGKGNWHPIPRCQRVKRQATRSMGYNPVARSEGRPFLFTRKTPVPRAGVEPAWMLLRKILSLVRMPVSPSRHLIFKEPYKYITAIKKFVNF